VGETPSEVSKSVVRLLFDDFVEVFVSVDILIEQNLALGSLVVEFGLRIEFDGLGEGFDSRLMLLKVRICDTNVVVYVSLDVSAGLVLQTLLQILYGRNILFIFIVGQPSPVVNHGVFLVDCQSIRKITDALLVLVQFEIYPASEDKEFLVFRLLLQ